jgi:hypothetical protein
MRQDVQKISGAALLFLSYVESSVQILSKSKNRLFVAPATNRRGRLFCMIFAEASNQNSNGETRQV